MGLFFLEKIVTTTSLRLCYLLDIYEGICDDGNLGRRFIIDEAISKNMLLPVFLILRSRERFVLCSRQIAHKAPNVVGQIPFDGIIEGGLSEPIRRVDRDKICAVSLRGREIKCSISLVLVRAKPFDDDFFIFMIERFC